VPVPKSRLKSEIQKVFVLDAQGGYAGEFVVVEDCVLEFGDFLAALPERGLADRESIFLGEYRATALNGDKVSLVAITKGPVQPEEVAWGKAAFAATETLLGGAEQGTVAGPDKAILENLAQALKKQEAQLMEREKALAAASKEVEARGRARETELQDLKRRLADADAQRQRMHEEMARIVKAHEPGGDVAKDRKQLEKDRKVVEQRALDLQAREEKVRQRELTAAAEHEKIENVRKENEAALAKLEAAKTPAPEFDVEAARREIDARVKIIQKKAFDLLDREEALRKREEELRELGGG
jgi:hypothetical protein